LFCPERQKASLLRNVTVQLVSLSIFTFILYQEGKRMMLSRSPSKSQLLMNF
jgi:hypothetical protein